MAAAKQRRNARVRWTPAVASVALFVLVTIGIYWNATVAIILALACVVIAGARAIASVQTASASEPVDDRSWAESVLSTSPAMKAAASAIEWLALGGTTFVVVAQPPIQVITKAAPYLLFLAALTVAFAIAEVAWERQNARRALRPTE